ncbi:MAG TPA: hypothetical protein VFZ17_07000, partial [Acidimicrobiia bacterium]|nr:hypothetical protein [Acidimicrobiia bacterium]
MTVLVLTVASMTAVGAGALQPPPGEGDPRTDPALVGAVCTFALSSTLPGPVTASVIALPPIDEPFAVELTHNGSVVQTIA